MPCTLPQTCPKCHIVQRQLSTHLRRQCMRRESEAAINAAVIQARAAVMAVVSRGVFIPYKELESLGSTETIVSFMEGRGFCIIDKPSSSSSREPAVQDSAEPSLPQEPESLLESQRDLPVPQIQQSEAGSSTQCNPPASTDSGCSNAEQPLDEVTQRVLQTKWTAQNRIKMLAAGLYRRHSLSDPVLKGFITYLRDTLGVAKYRHEVEDVARFLYFMNPKTPSLSFVHDIEKTHSYFTKLRQINLSNNTAISYLKHIRRFLTYQMRATNLAALQPELHKAAQFFMTVTEDIQKRLTKGSLKDAVRKRYMGLTKGTKTPADCQRLLTVAKPTFLQSIRSVREGQASHNDHLEILYYLQALLVLKHLQRPGVVRNLKVVEWKQRIQHTYKGETLKIIGVKCHKTSSTQVATFVLNVEEESWFQLYFENVRPALVTVDTPEDVFFLSTSGKEIYNVSNDIRRYHNKYHVPDISSQLVRRVCETWTLPRYNDAEKGLFARYLSHSNMTADRIYREKTLSDVCHSYNLVVRVSEAESQEPGARSHLDGSQQQPESEDSDREASCSTMSLRSRRPVPRSEADRPF